MRRFEWRVSDQLVPYPQAVSEMEERVAAIRAGTAAELIWLLEHPPLYTAGTSAKDHDLLTPDALPVFRTGRGGQYTYHGPGQRVAYVMMDLRPRGCDLRRHVNSLEEWAIRALARLSVRGERRTGRVGIWVARDGRGRQDRGHRCAGSPLDHFSRAGDQRRSGACALCRHRAVRHRRAVVGRHQPGRLRPPRLARQSRQRATREFR